MAFIKGIKGLGVKGANNYYDDTLPVPKVCVFDGARYYKVNSYIELANSVARTYLVLAKTAQPSLGQIYSTRLSGSTGEFIQYKTATGVRFKIGDNNNTNRAVVQTGIQLNNKWTTGLVYYNGDSVASTIETQQNGFKNTDLVSGNVIGNNTGSGFAYLGSDNFNITGYALTGSIAIFAIYKGSFTTQQQTEFASDPFGFMTRLRAIPAEKAKLHLDFKLDAGGNTIPTDMGEGNGGSPFTITAEGTGVTSYIDFA